MTANVIMLNGNGSLDVFLVESVAGTVAVVVRRVGVLLGLHATSTQLVTNLKKNCNTFNQK